MEKQTTILASGPGWTLRRDGDDPAVIELRPIWARLETSSAQIVMASVCPADLAALLTPRPGIVGELILAGDLSAETAAELIGLPLLIVRCTREELKDGPALVYRDVTVTPTGKDVTP
jgi:hypothetical protein